MAKASLMIAVEGAAEARRAFGEIAAEQRRANAGMTAAARQGSGDRRKLEAAEVADAQRAFREMMRGRQKSERDQTRAKLQAVAERKKAEADTLKAAEKAAKDGVKIAKAAAKERGRADREAAREAEQLSQQIFRSRAKYERDATREAERESRRRTTLARAEAAAVARNRGRGVAAGQSVVGAVVSTGGQIASGLHGDIQGVRADRAAQESALNTVFMQTTRDAAELALRAQRVRQFVTDHHLDMGAVVGSVGGAQSRFNALGGATPAARAAALDQTLRDVEFANVVDPTNLGGIPAFSAMLRQQGLGDAAREELLRASVGISFEGSVETDEALRAGLPGLQRNLSTSLARGRPEDHDAITRAAVVDFLSQLQSVAATGGRVGATANRINALQGVLNNTDTQDRLGAALARRAMTPEQRSEFNAAFSRDARGRYVMSDALKNSPSGAAAFFGHQFDNNAVAVANFLGPHGAGGNRQLINRPEANLLTSYFAMGHDASGRAMRQYDLVGTLSRSTLTPEDVAAMRRVRDAEDRATLSDDANLRAAALGDNTTSLNRLSTAFASFMARNPIAGAVGAPVAALLGGAILKSAGGTVGGALSTAAPGAVGAATAVSAWVAGGLAALAAGVGVGEIINRATTTDEGLRQTGGRHISILDTNTWRELWDGVTGGRVVGPAAASAGAPGGGAAAVGTVRLAPESITALAAAQAANPPTIAPADVVHAASANANGRPRPTIGE